METKRPEDEADGTVEEAALIDGEATTELDRARRHFLKAATYAAPAILATIALNTAHAQPSCMPVTCSPSVCMPIGP